MGKNRTRQYAAEPSFSCWDMTPPAIPPRSTLYQLSPCGMNTALVEALSSYICRLAQEHHLYPGILIHQVVAPLIAKPYVADGQSRSISAFLRVAVPMNGNGIMAEDWVRALEELTLHADLRQLTLLSLAAMLSDRGLLQKTRQWCPVCYATWHEAQAPVYDPLLWVINGVEVCPEHKCVLERRCPRCLRALPWLSWQSRPGHCSECGNWLGQTRAVRIGEGQDELIHVAHMIAQLIQNAGAGKMPFSQDVFTRSLTRMVQATTEGNSAAFARLIGFPKTTFWDMIKGRFPPQLPFLLRLCSQFHVTLPALLIEDTAAVLTVSLPSPITTPISSGLPKKDREILQQRLEEILADTTEPPPSMRQVARGLGYPQRTVDTIFPQLCKAITRRYKAYRKKRGEQRIHKLSQMIQQVALELHRQGINLTYQNVGAALGTPGCFRERPARIALQRIRQQLGMPEVLERHKQDSA